MPLSAKPNRIFIGNLKDHVEQEVMFAGWVATKRHHGKVVFLDIEDSTGKIQTVTTIDLPFFATATEVKEQSWVMAKGKIILRPPQLVTSGVNGNIEAQLTHITIVSQAKDLPWGSQSSDTVHEELRMHYRYLDIRTGRLRNTLQLRSQVLHFIRNYLFDRGFTEVETPYITKGTPEGAREYVVPSRLHAGQFYALPQSPQQFKQLLMVAGIDRYFQIARCFRDEDPRGDRQPEFTQLDMEMSFVMQEDILNLIEALCIALVEKITPEKHITQIPFPRLSYQEAMDRYGSDKPDLRQDKNNPNELAFAWVIDWPLFEYSSTEKKLVATHHLFTRPKAEDENLLDTEPEKVQGLIHDLVLNGYEVGGGSMRIHEPELQKKVFTILGISPEEAEKRFGHLLEAFSYGAPPHGGIAPGIDRLVMLLAGEPNIREVIAFPKTGDGRDLMMGAPSVITPDQLKELHLTIRNDNNKAAEYGS